MRYLFLAMLIMLASLTARADGVKVEIWDLQTIRLHFAHPVPSDFCASLNDCTKGKDPANYQLYEIVPSDNDRADLEVITEAQPTGCTTNGCSLFQLKLASELKSGSTYILKVNYPSSTATLTRFEMATEAK